MSKQRKLPKIKPNPCMLLTGAVAGSAVALLQSGDSAAYHQFNWYMGGVDDGGKMYDDIVSGQCGTSEWGCYMSLWASIVTTGENAVPSSLHDDIGRALDRWTATDTTLYYSLVADDPDNDVRVKEYDVPGAGLARTVMADYHGTLCPTGLYDWADCDDPDGNAAHQPERWWYSYIRLDPDFDDWNGNKDGVIAHELGHAIGLAHYPTPQSGRGGGCSPDSIMDYDCLDDNYVLPKAVDECAANHASGPLMYGDGGPTSDSGQDPHAWRSC
jgi:hypothetical protein